MKSAPARRMAVSDSRMIRSRSTQPAQMTTGGGPGRVSPTARGSPPPAPRRYLTAAVPGWADLVLSIFGGFSFPDPLPLLTATARTLRPGGRLAMALRADDHHDAVVVLRRR